MPDCHYTILRSTEELWAFSPTWLELCRQDPEATPFQQPEWLLPWWRQFGQPALLAVVISREAKPIGLLPFYVYREPYTGERQLLLIGAGTSDYLNGFFAPDCTVEDVQGALELLCAQDGWDVLYVSQVAQGSKLARAFDRFRGAKLHSFATDGCSRMPAVRLESLPAKIRRNAMYYRNRAMRLGALELAVADASNWRESFDALVRLHTARWQERDQPGVLADARVLAWHREAVPLLAESGHLRLYTLRLSGEIIAALYALIDAAPGPRAERTLYVYIPAYSARHADLRPGTVLLALAIDHAAGEGVQTIDMLRGDEAYKQIWHTQKVPTCGFSMQRPRSEADLHLAEANA